jgi:hypothetical protein
MHLKVFGNLLKQLVHRGATHPISLPLDMGDLDPQTGSTPLTLYRLTNDLEACIRAGGEPDGALEECLQSKSFNGRLRNPLWPVGCEWSDTFNVEDRAQALKTDLARDTALRDALVDEMARTQRDLAPERREELEVKRRAVQALTLQRDVELPILEHLHEAFGGRQPPSSLRHRAFERYAKMACSDCSAYMPTTSRPHFFPPHLVADAPPPGAPRSLSDKVDFAMRLWLFDRHCALEAIEKLLLHRLRLAQTLGVAEAQRNPLVQVTNRALVSALAGLCVCVCVCVC